MSAGGQFNYEFVAWKPERVAAFVVNKGGIYYSALVSQAAREVPGILFVGGKDLEFRTNTIVGLFAVNRRGGALWALAEEPAAAHIVGRSRDVALVFFDDMIPLRLGDQQDAQADRPRRPDSSATSRQRRSSRWATDRARSVPTAWLPTARVARAWQAHRERKSRFDPGGGAWLDRRASEFRVRAPSLAWRRDASRSSAVSRGSS